MNLYKRSHKIQTVLSLLGCVAVLFAVSCRFIGVGDETDMAAPAITITYPLPMEYVTDSLTITGTASDNTGVSKICIEVEATGQSWQCTGNTWQTKDPAAVAWHDVAGGTWVQEDKKVTWSVPVTLHIQPGVTDYTFSAQAYDDAQNSSEHSIAERSIQIDTSIPVVSVIAPQLIAGDFNVAKAVADTYQLQNPAIISKLINGTFIIQGTQKDDATLSSLKIILAGESADTVYFSKTLTEDLRNWSLSVSAAELPESLNTGKTCIQIITESIDTALNVEKKSNGWFVWYPEADIPWVVAPFGDADSPLVAEVYPGYALQGQAYDDDGLASVSASLYKLNADNTRENTPITSTVTNLSEQKPTYAPWSITAPAEKGTYCVSVAATDINGKTSIQTIRYFTVQDINAPNITVTSPVSGASVLGDKSGNITFIGSVDDDGTITSLKMVRIKGCTAENQKKYLDSTSSRWNNATESGTTDGDGNKVWLIPLGTQDKNDKNRYEASFSKTFNLFTDFGVNGNDEKLSNQICIFCVEDSSKSKRIVTLSFAGDIEQPELSITAIIVDGTNHPFEENSVLTIPPFSPGTTVKLMGKWKDNTSWIGDITLTWLGMPPGVTVTRDIAAKTWETSEFPPPTAATAAITASLTDWGGNTATDTACFYVEGALPAFVRLSSANSDGAYKAGSVINITTEFNKNVTFSNGAGNPSLVLSTGRTAVYKSGNNTNKHVYEYTVVSGDTSADLDVLSINLNGNKWCDGSNNELVSITTLPTGTNSLAGGRNIVIDTTAPVISGVSSLTSVGDYNAGKSIYIAMTFSEPVSIQNSNLLTLVLNGLTAGSATVTSSQTVLFTYTASAGDTASPIKVTGCNPGTAVVTDVAGNEADFSITATDLTGINIDTAVPVAPGISGLSSGTTYADSGQTFSVSGEGGAVLEYTVDGGSSWISYVSSVTLTANGSYTISARQTDKAGNRSPASSPVLVTVDKGSVLSRISSSKSDGTYTTGDTVPITLYCRKPVTVTGTPVITLNTTPQRTAVYTGGSGTTALSFTYTITVGDAVDCLDVTGINLPSGAALTDEGGTNVVPYMPVPVAGSGSRLKELRSISVITAAPVVTDVALNDDGTQLTVTFSAPVYKNTGVIELEQLETGYRVPAVLSKEAYTELVHAAAGIADYYEEGTNGYNTVTDAADTSAKYVLKYTYNTDNTELCSLFDAAGARTVSIPVASSAVSITGAQLTVNLTGTYALPVKGAQYTVSIPASLVTDILSQPSSAKTIGSADALTASGVETPVIRINKQQETITNGAAVQPLTAGVKMDCQTPGASIKYTVTQETSNVRTLSDTYLPSNGTTRTIMPSDTGSNVAAADTVSPQTSGTTYTGAFTIGSGANTTVGYKCLIRAQSQSGSSWSLDTYEAAYRSVVTFNYNLNDAERNAIWIRGGDSESGGVGISGFPFSWDTSEYSKVRLMTKKAGSNDWYWVSWNINTTAYVGFLSGNVPTDAAENGPRLWCWGSCSWVSSKLYYPVYPGESLSLPTGNDVMTTICGQGLGAYGFQDKHRESR